MNESEIDWDDLRLFLAVARGGGLAAAAAVSGKSAPTLGRRMLALERRLGRDLFRRMARGYVLTEDGEALLGQAAALESRVLSIFEGPRAAPLVKVSAGTWVTRLLCENAADLVGSGGVRLRFIAAEAALDIGRREALIGVRNARPEGIGLAGRRIGRIRFAVYATGAEITPWARVIGSTPSARWVEANARDAPAIEVTSPRNALDLALAGAARVVLPTFIGARLDGLQPQSPPIDDLEHDQWLVTHHEDRFLPEVRRVIERMHGLLKQACAFS